ncbi:MAG: phosphoserine phosphatase SerB [Gammaproteobacteria bacterium AqS3]|nr:phosphoserine phosphatase SerB [Gammaproteobacteria bacterium AqS3]
METILLITILGQDAPGLTASLSRIIERSGGVVLDIGQAVIHNKLCSGMMLHLPHPKDDPQIAELRGAMRIWAEGHDLDLDIAVISHDQYRDWVDRKGSTRHIVTLVSRKVYARQISAITEICSKHNLTIDNITRLSGRVPLDGECDSQVHACVEFSVRGAVDNKKLRRAFLRVTRKQPVDISVQVDDIYRRNRRVVILDMDSTLITGEVIDELGRHHGVGAEISRITRAAMRGEIDFTESLHRRVSLLRGLSVEVMGRIAEDLKFNPGAERLVRTLHHLGLQSAIVSGGFDFFAAHVQQRLGITWAHANRLRVVGGVLTGEVVGPVVDAARKAGLLKEICRRSGYDTRQAIAVGDGANDLPMLGRAGLGIAFHAKPRVKSNAQQTVNHLGLDAILYLLGLRDRDLDDPKLPDFVAEAPRPSSALNRVVENA